MPQPSCSTTCFVPESHKVSLEHKSSRWGIFIAITNNTLYESKLLILYLCKNHKDIKIMLHEDIL